MSVTVAHATLFSGMPPRTMGTVLEVDQPLELTILMPCLDEAETLRVCIDKARGFLSRADIAGEVLVADNGSTDGSPQIAREAGARVVDVPARGYGSALLTGIHAARGRFVIMGDADDSYDFSDLSAFVRELRAGRDLVMGNRFAGKIEDGAMPALHRYLGNPVLSLIGRVFFRTNIRDFHCGLRGFSRQRILDLRLHTTGMEFASEIVVRSVLAGYRVAEVPITLSRDGRSRPSHLRSFRDGWRHLRFLLLYSPRWLFLIPGLVLIGVGASATTVLLIGPVRVGSVTFDVGTLLYADAALCVGVQAVAFALLTQVYAIEEGFLPRDRRLDRIARWLGVETGLILASVLILLGVLAAVGSLFYWRARSFGELDAVSVVRVIVPAVTGFVVGSQIGLTSFFLSVLGLGLERRSRLDEQPPVPRATTPEAVRIPVIEVPHPGDGAAT